MNINSPGAWLRLRTACATSLRPLLLLMLMLPAAVQAQFNYTTNNGTITITGYSGPGGAVAIPATINGLPVTRIGDSAFYRYTTLTSVTIPNSVASIGDWSFGLCTSLTSVTIPNSVTSIGNYAFASCTSLTSVTIPNSVTSIGDSAFYSCTSLSAITVDAVNSFYSSLDGVLFNKSRTLLIQYPGGKAGSYTIPNSVTSIRDGAFESCISLTSITIPNSVTSIGGGAFYGCTSLSSITIPNSVTSIGGGALAYCTSLNAITVDALNSFYSSVGGVLFNKSQILLIQYPGGKAGSYTIPNSVTSIGQSAFESCTSLTSVTIPNSVISIGYWAFAYCTSLTSVTIPSSVTSIDGEAFGSCTSLASVTILNGVNSIGTYAFSYCTSLTSVTIPNSVTWIGYGAFYSCTSLSAITVDALNSFYSSVDGVLLNKSQTLLIQYPGGKAGSYTIPNSVTSIGDLAFFYCPSLSAITVDALNSVYSSVDGVLFNKSQTLLIQYPGGKAGSYMIHNSVTSIGVAAFAGCTSLTSVRILNSVTTIGNYAFGECTSLTGVYFQGNAPSVGEGVFGGATNATVYYLPGTTGWGTTFAGRPTVLWNPLVETSDASFGVGMNGLGFTITWANDLVIVVEACTNLTNPAWTPVGTNTLTGGSSYFSDPEWTNHPARFYRLRSP